MRIGIISQARVNSSRLPNKIFLEAKGKPFLEYHVQRLQKTGIPVYIATTDDGSEAPIVNFCLDRELPCFRGSEQDVLARFYHCASHYQLDTIIRVTSDCPLIDPQIITGGLALYNEGSQGTYCSNALKRTFPRGMDFEIFSFDLLKDAFENAVDSSDREHVTPYIWKNKSGKVTTKDFLNTNDKSEYRITLDTEEDRLLITRLISEFGADEMDCGQMVKLLELHPELVAINRHIEQKKI